MTKHLLFLVGLIALSTIQIKAQSYSGGKGTKEDPFQIATVEDLNSLSKATDEGDDYGKGMYFIQTQDIHFVRNEDEGNFEPIGGVAGTDDKGNYIMKKFEGTYDGQNHFISDLCIIKPENVIALFAYVGKSATISNLHLKNCSVQANGIVGMFAGINNGKITNCSTDNKCKLLSGGSYLGGIVSNNSKGTIENCSNAAQVWAVMGGQLIVGGIVGDNDGVVKKCSNTGNITGPAYVGGIAGITRDGSNVSYCYNMGKITGKGSDMAGGTGGIAGCLTVETEGSYNKISCSYNAGFVNAPIDGGAIIGKVLPESTKDIEDNCYYDNTTSNSSDSFATGMTSEEMKSEAFLNKINQKNAKIFVKDTANINNGYPILDASASEGTIEATEGVLTDHDIKIANAQRHSLLIKAGSELLGQKLTIYSIDGTIIDRQIISSDGNLVNNINDSLVIVKAGYCIPIKVLMKQ